MNYCRGKFLRIYSKFPVRKYSVKTKKKGCELAQEYFDVSYSNVYGNDWPAIRMGLLSEPKFVSIINNQCPKYEQTIEKFQELGCYDVGARYRKSCDEVLLQQRSLVAVNNEDDRAEQNLKALEDSSDEHNSASSGHRKPIREFTDDELSELANAPAPLVYPKEFRALSGSPEAMLNQQPESDRLIPAQRHVELDVQLQALQDFVPSQGLAGLPGLSDESAIFEKYRASLESDDVPAIDVEKQTTPITWPDMLRVMAFPRLNNTRFPMPRPDSSGLFDHYPLDGGSVLPVLLLDVKTGHSVLDLCAAPGGKSLALLQTTLPDFLHCNDKAVGRVVRLKTIMKQYFGDTSRATKSLQVTQLDGTLLAAGETGLFDRVLVDAPCLSDRHSLQEQDDNNNIFNLGRREERLTLPELQADLLIRALQLVRVGGTVVYSTCSLSPMQNDGVVHLALSRLWDHSNMQCTVVDFSRALKPLKFFLDFGQQHGLKYGQVVLPRASNNFGPTYCAKIIRKK